MRNYHSRVFDYLRDEYGVAIGSDDVRHGTNHDYLEFDYAGKRRRLTLNAGDGTNVLKLKLQDIRRDLGPPPEQSPDRQKRSLEDMMPAFNPLPLEALSTSPESLTKKTCCLSARGTVGNHQSNECIYFVFPAVIAECLDRSVKYVVKRTGDDSWEIVEGGHSSLRRIGGGWCISASSKMSGLAGDLGYFSRYPADYVVGDGHMLVSLVERKSVAPQTSRKPKEPMKTAEYLQKIRTEYDPDNAAATGMSFAWKPVITIEARMKTVLTELRELESSGPYRLIKTKEGRWEFRAPSVRLENGDG